MTFVNASATSAANVSAVTLTSFVLSGGTNRKVIAQVAQEDNAAASWSCENVAFNGSNMARLAPTAADLDVDTSRRRLSMWYIDQASLPGAGEYSCTASMTGGAGSIDALGIIVAEYTGLAAGAGVDPTTALTNPGTVTSLTITPTAANSTVITGGMNTAGSGTGAADGTGITVTERIDEPFQANANHYLHDGDLASPGDVQVGITWSASGTLGQISVALSPATAATVTTNKLLGAGGLLGAAPLSHLRLVG